MSGAQLADHVVDSPEAANLQVLPATIDLAGAEIELVSVVARESRLPPIPARLLFRIIASTTSFSGLSAIARSADRQRPGGSRTRSWFRSSASTTPSRGHPAIARTIDLVRAS